jgi:dipeptidase E
MRQRLLLTSQGIQPDLRDTFLGMVKKPSEASVAFVTTAAYGDEKNPEWLEIYRSQLRVCGIDDISDLDLKGKDREQLLHELTNKDIIFVNGGNTFYLLYHVKKSSFGAILPELLGEGKLYFGVSAGSYIVCPTIEAAEWKHSDKNRVRIKDLTALSLVPFLITAHFAEKYRPVVERAAAGTKYPIVALCDTQAVLVEGGSYRVVGRGPKEFFNGFAEDS